MKIKLTNRDIPTEVWEKNFTREQLRKLAKAHDIARGRNKITTARFLHAGLSHTGEKRTFEVVLEVDL